MVRYSTEQHVFLDEKKKEMLWQMCS